jgi:FkbM family methyltransferase
MAGQRAFIDRLVRLPLALVPRMRPLPILSGPLAGKRWLSTSGTHGCWLGVYERDLQRALAQTLKDDDVFYDVGANVGFFSLFASQRVRQVIAFEPLPRNLELLRGNLALNGVRNVQIIEAAVAREPGHVSFAAEGSASMGHIAASGGMRVAAVALDAFVAQGRAAPPTVIKMDIEGAESQALAGAEQVLRTHRPRIFLSTHGWQQHEACGRFLESLGYRVQLRRNGAADGQYESIALP